MADNQASLSNYKVPGMRGTRLGERQREKPNDGKGTMKRLVRYFSREKMRIGVLVAAVSIVALCSVYVPNLQSRAIDSIAAGDYGVLGQVLAMMLAVYLVNSFFTLVQGRVSAILSQSIVRRMRTDLFGKIVNLSVSYIDSHPHGDIMSRMTNDIENISNTVSQSLSSLVSGVLTMIGTVVMMVYFCPRLALLSCTTVLLTLLATKYLSKAMRMFFRKRQVILGELNSTVEEMVGGYHTVTAYNRQEEVIAQFDKSSDALTKTGIMAEIFGGSMGPVMNVINNIGFVIIAAFGGYFAIKGVISIGVISAFIVYAKQFGRPIDELAQIYGQIQTAIAGAERVFAIMDEPEEDKSGENTMENIVGNISFQNVNFSYVKGKQVLNNFNIDVRAGHKIALVGSTGSGKTTVVNLLMRFYDIDSGAIAIDGVNIRDIDCRELRKNIAIVLQDTILFADSIRNNLR
ncbi:MAG: ABC transporter ATP-binding protein/permease, partial [Lachnospiraceae bacterium]|nr:ABC transporter ATP-binding protein/permease [Lachnospiraceae bacterium]